MKTKDRLCAALKRATEEPPTDQELIEAPDQPGRVDETPSPDEIEDDDVQGETLTGDGEDENRLAPTEKDWRMLGGFTGLNFRRLMSDRRDLNPLECSLEIYRESPSFQAGRAITCGHLAEYNSDWPFPKFNILLCEIGKRYGGGRYSFRVYDSNHSLIRGRIMPIAGDAKNPPPLPEQQEEDYERTPVTFLEPSGGGNGDAEDATPDEASDFEDIAKREEQMTRIAALRSQRRAVEHEANPARDGQPPAPNPALAAIEELKKTLAEKGSDQNGLALVLASMQSSQAQMMESLKMVVSGIGEKLAGQQSSQTEMFKLLVQMSDSRSSANSEIAKVQMEAKKSEMELMLKLMGERREQQEMNLDKMLDLLHMGMDLKANIGGGGGGGGEGEGGGEGDWLTKALSGLSTIITQGAMGSAKIPEVNPDQPALPAPDAEAQKRFIEEAAARAAATIAKKAQARQAQIRLRLAAQRARTRGAPAPAAPAPAAPPPAPMDPEAYKRAVMHQVLFIVNAELDSPPQLSAAVKFSLQKGPPDWKAAMLKTDNALELANYFKPYAEDALVESIKAKLAGSEQKQQWLMYQAGTLRAYLQRQAPAQQAPPPAAPPQAATEEVTEVDESELENGVEPIPDENSVQVEGGGM